MMETICGIVSEQKQKEFRPVFSLTECEREIIEQGIMIVYGVKVLMKIESEEISFTISKISPDRMLVQTFIADLIKHEVSPIHVYDVLFNFIEEY